MNPPLGTKSLLVRDTAYYPKEDLGIPEHLLMTGFFSIQWHITNSCDLHACRKFPSPIGNINRKSLAQIYDSRVAKRYRKGNCACTKCPIKPLCGGCMASIHSHGLDIFRDRDPYCFIDRT
jgi:radical SAM protein with 4Fe4S-binding SPASM domain